MRDIPNLDDCRAQIEAATRVAMGLREAVLLQSHNMAARNRKSYLEILTPDQAVKYKEWLAKNTQKCREMCKSTLETASSSADSMEAESSSENQTMMEVCRKLEEVLKISKSTSG